MAEGSTVSELKGKISLEGADDAKKQLDSLGSKTDDTGSAFKRALGSTVGFLAGFTGFGLATSAVDMLTDHWNEWVEGAKDAQVMQAQTNQILSSSSHVMGLTTDQVDALATKTMDLTGVDDDLVHGAENILAGFGSISKSTFPDATQAATDLAISYKMAHGGQLDLTASAQVLGRALENPLQGVRQLRQYNIILSQSQQDQIKQFMAVNDVADAQKVIMDAVKDKVGGAADAFGSTAEGKMMRFDTAMGNIGKTIGGLALPAMSDLLDAVNPLVQAVADNLGPIIDDITSKMGAFSDYLSPLTGILRQAGDAVSTLAGIFQGTFSQAMQGVGGNLGDMLPDMRDVAFVVSGLVVKFEDAAKGPIADFARSLAGLVKDGFQLLSNVLHGGFLNDLQTTATTLASQLAPTVLQLATWFRTQLLPAIQTVAPQFAGLSATIVSVLVPAVLTIYQHFVQLEGWLLQHILPVLEAIIPPIIQVAGWLVGQLTAGIKAATTGAQGMSPVLQALGGFFAQMLPPLQQFVDGVQTRLQPIMAALQVIIDTIVMPALARLGDAIGPQLKIALDLLQGVWGVVWPVIQTVFVQVWNIITTTVKVAWDIISGIINVGLDLLSGNWKQAWTDVQAMFYNVWKDMTSFVTNTMQNMQKMFGTIGGNILGTLKNIWNDVNGATHNAFQNTVDDIKGFFTGLPQWFEGIGGDMIQALVSAIGNGAGALGTAVHNLLAGALHNLPGGISIPGFASGTNSAPGGVARVGEGQYAELVVGPHLMNVPQGTGIYPVQFGSGGNGDGQQVNQTFQAGAIVIQGAGMSADEIYDAWQQRASWLARGQGRG